MFATLRIALMAIRRNVLRSFLTMLGIIAHRRRYRRCQHGYRSQGGGR